MEEEQWRRRRKKKKMRQRDMYYCTKLTNYLFTGNFSSILPGNAKY